MACVHTFKRLGFSDDELVALCSAHSLGRHASLLGVSEVPAHEASHVGCLHRDW